MNKETQKIKIDEIENMLLDFNRGDCELLGYREVYFILDLIKRFVRKNGEIKELKTEIRGKIEG